MTTARLQVGLNISLNTTEKLEQIVNEFYDNQYKFFYDLTRLRKVLTEPYIIFLLSEKYRHKLLKFMEPYELLVKLGNPLCLQHPDPKSSILEIINIMHAQHIKFTIILDAVNLCAKQQTEFQKFINKFEIKYPDIFKWISNTLESVSDLDAPYNPHALRSEIIKPVQLFPRYVLFLSRLIDDFSTEIEDLLPALNTSLIYLKQLTEGLTHDNLSKLRTKSFSAATFTEKVKVKRSLSQ